MFTNLYFHEICTLLSRLRVSFLHVCLASKWVLHLAGPQDIIEDQVNLKLLVVAKLLLTLFFFWKNSVFFISQLFEFWHINHKFNYRNTCLIYKHIRVDPLKRIKTSMYPFHGCHCQSSQRMCIHECARAIDDAMDRDIHVTCIDGEFSCHWSIDFELDPFLRHLDVGLSS